MSTLLFGAGSMLGWSIWRARGARDVTGFVNASTKPLPEGISRGIDLDEPTQVAALFAVEKPDLVIHCAGVCDVETCETSPEFARMVNVTGTRILLDHLSPSTRLVYLSSDHVFGHGGTGPYDEGATTAPISVYGHTRVEAEALILARASSLVIRSGLWLGPSSNNRIGHLDWLRDRSRRNLPMTIVEDEIRSTSWAEDAACRVWDLAASTITGIRHVTAARAIARPELAAHLIERFAIGSTFETQPRATRRAPHIGNVELATRYTDALAAPLPPVIE